MAAIMTVVLGVGSWVPYFGFRLNIREHMFFFVGNVLEFETEYMFGA